MTAAVSNSRCLSFQNLYKVLTGARVVGLEKMEREKRLHMLVNEYLRVYCKAGEKGQEVYM